MKTGQLYVFCLGFIAGVAIGYIGFIDSFDYAKDIENKLNDCAKQHDVYKCKLITIPKLNTEIINADSN